MNTQTVPAATKDVIESSRKTLINVIAAGRTSTRGALNAYDQVWKSGAAALARVPDVVATTLRDDLVSLEGQLTLIANVLAQGVADSVEETANRAANVATGAVDSFERVFDMRVMDALDRNGVPSAEPIRELADRIAPLARDIARLTDLVRPVVAAPSQKPRAKSRKGRPSVKRGARAVA